jgi:hypothetical protein
MFQVYVSNVSSVFPDVCSQVFYLDVAYIFTSVSEVCSKCFRTYVANVFNLDVSKVDLMLQQVFHMHVSSVSSAFKRMLQVLHLDVFKNRSSVASRSSLFCCLASASVSPPPLAPTGHLPPPLSLSRCW